MPRQLIRTCELPGAAFPGALVGLLPCKRQRDTRLVLRHFLSVTTKPALSIGKLLFAVDFLFGKPLPEKLAFPSAGLGSERRGCQSRRSCCDIWQVSERLHPQLQVNDFAVKISKGTNWWLLDVTTMGRLKWDNRTLPRLIWLKLTINYKG